MKTVSAYANYNNGEIVFGVDDNGDLIGNEHQPGAVKFKEFDDPSI